MKKEDFAKLEVKGMMLLTDFSFCTFSFCAKKVSLLSEKALERVWSSCFRSTSRVNMSYEILQRTGTRTAGLRKTLG